MIWSFSAGMALVWSASIALAMGADPIRLPTLNVDTDSVAIAGFDHSADFAHQFHISFSSLVSGSCIFAGQPFKCANTHFPGDGLELHTPWSRVPHCDGCPKGFTLKPGHCHHSPDVVDVGSVVDYPRRHCGQNPIKIQECIDAVEMFFRSKIFLFRGSHDDVTVHGAVENTVGLLAQLLPDPARQIRLVSDQPFSHELPLNSTAHFNSSTPAGYDGPGECLRHVFGASLFAGSSKESNWAAFDQTEFSDNDVGFQEQGWIYIPDQCKTNGKATCKLVIRPDTCSPSEKVFAPDAQDFAKYAEANNIIFLHPCLGGHVDTKKYPHAYDVVKGKLDVYGQLGPNYVEQSAPHMSTIGKMLRRVLGVQAGTVGSVAKRLTTITADKEKDLELPMSSSNLTNWPWPFAKKLPKLQIKGTVLIAGCSNEADFSHQFQVAYSSLVKGSCIFSGQPYHCAATRFPNDYLVPKSKSTAAGIHCDDCPEDGTLIYDHCKNHPKWVDINTLAKYAETAKNVDDPRIHLADARVFSFGPTHDRCYQPPAMENVANFHLRYAQNSTQVKLVEDQPFPHTLPTNNTPYYNHSQGAGYDGPGECLRHVIGHEKPLRWAVPSLDRKSVWTPRSVSDYVPDEHVGMWPWAWLMLPPQCKDGPCHLLILPGSCDPFNAPGGSDDDFARYGVTNDMVILKTCAGNPFIDKKRFPDNHENVRGMVDVYGQLSEDYATQKGDQMEPIGRMMKRLMGVEDDEAVYV